VDFPREISIVIARSPSLGVKDDVAISGREVRLLRPLSFTLPMKGEG